MRIVFTILFISFLFCIDLYVYQAVKTILKNSHSAIRTGGSVFFWALSGYVFVSFLLTAILGMEKMPKWLVISSTSIFSLFILSKLIIVLWVFGEDIYRGSKFIIQKLIGKREITQIDGRRAFISNLAVVTAAIPVISLVYGIVRNAYRYQFTNVSVPLKNLPDSFDGFRIVQLSDIHSGSFTQKEPIIQCIEKINALEADVILFTGDLVNDLASEMDDYQSIFSKLKAKHGVLSVTGNHDYADYYYGPVENAAKSENFEAFKKVHADMGWDLLMDEHRSIRRGNDEIAIIGIQNWGSGGHFKQYGDLKKAYTGTAHSPIKILMSHDPSHWDAQVRPQYPDIDLMLSGHTHGMQFGVENKWLKWSPVQYVYKQWAGLYQKNNQYLYVNRGFGFIGYPGRIGILPEVTILELKKA